MLNSVKLLALLILLLVLGGAAYQWLSERADRATIPGELIAIDDHEFHLLCQGEGSPLVLLENGLWGSYPDWQYVLDGVSPVTRVCAYDRLGIGWSSANDKPTRAADVSDYLHRILQAAKLDEPMILVGFSAGGLYVRNYYHRYPQQVVGMVLLDSSHEQQHQRIPESASDLSLQRFCAAVAWTGVGRAFDLLAPFADPSFDGELLAEQVRVFNRTGFCPGMLLQSEGFNLDHAAGRPPGDLGDLPLTVIRAGKSIREQEYDPGMSETFLDGYEREWPLLQAELSRLSTNGRLLVAERSGHAIQLQQPAIAIEAILQMVTAWRAEGAGRPEPAN